MHSYISGEPRLKLNFEDFPQSLEYSSILSTQNDELAGIINDPPTDFEHDRQDNSNSISDSYLQESPTQLDQQSAAPLFEGSNLTCASSSILIMKYAMKHNITKDALSDLLDLLRLHCPKPNSCPSTLYYLKKQFKHLDYPVKFHYFCNECFHEVIDPQQSTVCGNSHCITDLSNSKSISSFIEILIDLQLKCILEREE